MVDENCFHNRSDAQEPTQTQLDQLRTKLLDLECQNESLIAANRGLQEDAARLKRVLDGADEGFWDWDLTTQEFFVSERYESMLGFKLGERDLSPEKWAEYVHPEDLARALESINRHLAGLTPNHEVELRCVTKCGAYKYILTRGRVVSRDSRGKPVMMAGTHTDISERKALEIELASCRERLEDLVAMKTAELLAANSDLEGISFATSHDLKGPLGRILNFSDLLLRRYQDQLEEDGLQSLKFIQENAHRLYKLVDELIDHARIGQQALELQPIDLLGLVQSVLKEQSADIYETGAKIVVTLAPAAVLADYHSIYQVVHNLVENALKYSAGAPQPKIEIGGEEILGSRYRLWVKDNGAGFDMKYKEKIFEIFRRLHAYHDIPGTGVGLALVKRAIERMGGRVWAESEPGNGAAFFLELRTARSLLNK